MTAALITAAAAALITSAAAALAAVTALVRGLRTEKMTAARLRRMNDRINSL